jgi:sigma-54 dependent transcriptional regulator, acetoin dehydrogenase operon transcriptional activator AcoR
MAVAPDRLALTAVGERERLTRAAWEKFIAGDDDVQGVPPLILLSWLRSRDVYRVDPLHSSPPPSTGLRPPGSLLQNVVLTRLGAVAAALADRAEDALTTVTDGSGRILGCWGGAQLRRRAAHSHLAPMFTWSESAAGTNGMGTALGRTRAVGVYGPEHWCASLHDWNCNGVSVGDATCGGSLAVLNISFWRTTPSAALGEDLERAVAPLRALVRDCAMRDGTALVEAFSGVSRAADPAAAVVAVDAAGTVIAANRRAQELGDGLPTTPAIEPERRCAPSSPQLSAIAAESSARLATDPAWLGSARLDVLREPMTFDVRPIVSDGAFVGILLTASDNAEGEPMGDQPEVTSGDRWRRIIGTSDNRLIIIVPGEIRYVEADRHAVWLVTDRGRVRAASRGLDQVERELRPFGFLRVHRSYLVNVRRIREVEQGLGRGTLTVSTQHHGKEAIPVARRHVATLRAALGI